MSHNKQGIPVGQQAEKAGNNGAAQTVADRADKTAGAHCEGFPPSVDADCRVLVLGSMPSVRSLAAQQYYAHPQNRFWPLMTQLLTGEKQPSADYAARLQMLRAHHIALWDAIATCERQGSLDTAIHAEVGNDFTQFLQSYPKIHTILCDGTKAYQCFCRYNKPLLTRPDLNIRQMPSTSPANARWRLPMLLETWGEALRQEISFPSCDNIC